MTAVRIDAGAAALRRTLGPMPWCALDSLPKWPSDGPTAAAVRSIATDFGVATNTAHRAVPALVCAGAIDPVSCRHAAGRFRSRRYRLHVADVVGVDTTEPTATPMQSGPSRRSRRRAEDAELALHNGD
jgi:hypothetical protein